MQMQYLQFIKNVSVDQASYHLEDEIGNRIELQVDYDNNSFDIKKSENLAENFVKEVEQFARGLLARKHGVNLAKREQYL